jgi:hypothetical protein
MVRAKGKNPGEASRNPPTPLTSEAEQTSKGKKITTKEDVSSFHPTRTGEDE